MHRVDALSATALMFAFGAVPIVMFGGSALIRSTSPRSRRSRGSGRRSSLPFRRGPTS
jgi:hypothetical protein